MGVIREEPGAVLAVAEKPEALDFLKSALAPYRKQVCRVSNMEEAKQKILRERISILVFFLPLADGTGIDAAAELADRKALPSIVLVGAEMYSESLYRARGKRIYVLAYPARKSIMAQTVNVLLASQRQLHTVTAERDALQEKLTDLSVINRAKLVLVEKKGLSEDEAHHQVERIAMDRGITKRKAAEYLLRILG